MLDWGARMDDLIMKSEDFKSNSRSFYKKSMKRSWKWEVEISEEEPDVWGTTKVAKDPITLKTLINVKSKINGLQNFLRNFIF